ncbi:hypothetical protein MKW94_030695 [Papaver nudicaule]|uniref:Uncharacterized protein n=1 Tax=Papaver nudicaule TaxID=74823 RepID=A0AA41RYM2_PAPNU|nr:hypothetical protein [Papaver nudicaule]
MASLSLKTVGPSSSSSAFSGTSKGSTATTKRRTQLTLVTKNHFQVRSERIIEQQPKSQKVESVSRRDAMLSAGALAAITLFSADTAEAHIVNPEIKRKFFEKFRMLREKAGLSKPKAEDKKTDKEKAKPPSAEHKHNLPASKPPTTLPKEKIAEATKKETPPPLVHQNSSQAG